MRQLFIPLLLQWIHLIFLLLPVLNWQYCAMWYHIVAEDVSEMSLAKSFDVGTNYMTSVCMCTYVCMCTCSMVRGRLQRNYGAGKTRTALRAVLSICCAFWFNQELWTKTLWLSVTGGQVAKAMAGATNEPWRSREPFVSLQARRRWALVARGAIESGGPVGRGNAGPKRYGCAGSGEFSLSLSSIHAPPKLLLSKLKYIHSSAKRLYSDAV